MEVALWLVVIVVLLAASLGFALAASRAKEAELPLADEQDVPQLAKHGAAHAGPQSSAPPVKEQVSEAAEQGTRKLEQPARPGLSLAGQIIARERATWEATKNKDRAALNILLADDYREVFDGGVRSKEETLDSLDEGYIAGYWLDDVKVTEHDHEVAVITYKVRVDGIYKGQHFPDKPYYTTSIWVRRNGEWQAVLTWAPS